MQFSAIVNSFIVKNILNSAFTNDLKTKIKISKNDHSLLPSLFKAPIATAADDKFCNISLNFSEKIRYDNS